MNYITDPPLSEDCNQPWGLDKLTQMGHLISLKISIKISKMLQNIHVTDGHYMVYQLI
jgi:hypothetical protein